MQNMPKSAAAALQPREMVLVQWKHAWIRGHNARWARELWLVVMLLAMVMPVSAYAQATPAVAERLQALGLVPRYLAAVGVVPADMPAIVAAASDSRELADYEAAQVAFRDESDAMQAAMDAYVREPTAEHLAVCLAARGAAQVRAAALTGLRRQAVLDLLQPCAPGVADAAAEGVDQCLRGLWPELCVIAWTPEEAAILRRAVRAEAVGRHPTGHPLLRILSEAKSRPEVILASGRVASNVDAITSAFVSDQ